MKNFTKCVNVRRWNKRIKFNVFTKRMIFLQSNPSHGAHRYYLSSFLLYYARIGTRYFYSNEVRQKCRYNRSGCATDLR